MAIPRGPRPHGSVEISASVLGRAAARALRLEPSWKVAAVFRRSFYCRSLSGSFVCFGPTSLGRGPLNVLYDTSQPIDWEAAGLTTDSPAVCHGTVFRVTGHCVFWLSRAEAWRPAGLSARWKAETVLDGLAVLARRVRIQPARGGLQSLIPILAGNAAASLGAVRPDSPLTLTAMEGIKTLAAWLEARLAHVEPGPAPTRALDALIGLGPGLTPSGDDFLGGVLVALYQLGLSDVAGGLARGVLARAELRTNDISRAHLAAAADGEGLAPLHGILASLCAPGAPGLGHALAAVDAIGHTSGWDAVAGIAAAAAAAARVHAVRGGVGGAA